MPEREKLNPSNMGGASRLLRDPKALDEALESGLDRGSPSRGLSARGFSDAEQRKLKRDSGAGDY